MPDLKRALRLFLILSFLLATGCTSLRQPPKPISFYTLGYDAPKPIATKPKPAVIYLKRLQGLPPFSSRQIVYGTSQCKRNVYHYHQWIADPADMVTTLLARDLRHTNIAEAVVTSPGELPITNRLMGTLNDFYEYDEKAGWKAEISLTLLFTREKPDGSQQFIFQKTYRATRPLGQKNPLGLSKAMSRALSDISARVAADINRNLD